MKQQRTSLRRAIGAAVVTTGLGITLVGVAGSPASADPPEKIDICHANRGEGNFYNKQNVALSSVDGEGEGDHYLEHDEPAYVDGATEWGDIIPPIEGVHDGLNWDARGQAIYNHPLGDCNIAPVPSATIVECQSGDIVVTLANAQTGTADAAFTVLVDGIALTLDEDDAVVAPNESDTVEIPQTEDVPTTVAVLLGQSTVAGPTVLAGDCSQTTPAPVPGASIAECAGSQGAPGIVVTLTNVGGTADAAYTVLVGGSAVTLDADDAVVSPGETDTVEIPQVEDVASTVEVRLGEATVAGPTALAGNCDRGGEDPPLPVVVVTTSPVPGASMAECVGPDGGAGGLLTLTNTGDADAVFTVTIDGAALESIVVEPLGDSEAVSVPQVEDVATTVVVTSGAFTRTFVLSGDCVEPVPASVPAVQPATQEQAAPSLLPTEVEGVQEVRQPAVLARTGTTTGPLVAVAGALIVLGGLALYGSTIPAIARRR